MIAAQAVVLCLTVVCVILVVLALIMLWFDLRREHAEAELDRQHQDILTLAAQLSNDLRDQGLNGRIALIREARRASGRSPSTK